MVRGGGNCLEAEVNSSVKERLKVNRINTLCNDARLKLDNVEGCSEREYWFL